MSWNLEPSHIDSLLEVARDTHSYIRINVAKSYDSQITPSARQLMRAFRILLSESVSVVIAEPLLKEFFGLSVQPPACGVRTFRINSPDDLGRVSI